MKSDIGENDHEQQAKQEKLRFLHAVLLQLITFLMPGSSMHKDVMGVIQRNPIRHREADLSLAEKLTSVYQGMIGRKKTWRHYIIGDHRRILSFIPC